MPLISHQNFRLRGIPRECLSKGEVRAIVKKALSIGPDAGLVIHSLANNPTIEDSKVATLSFQSIPDCLCGRCSDEWKFSLSANDDLAEEDSSGILVFDSHFRGFTPLQGTKDEDCHVDVIALTGLGGHAFGSFKEKQGPFMWLRDALPLDVPEARILIYGYDSSTIQSSSFQNLTDLGRTLYVGMKGIREPGQTRPTIFIGHSLGGLVIKEAIVKLREDLQEQDASMLKLTSGILFFGVPHEGMAVESLVPLVKDYPNRSLLESLSKNSALLQRLGTEFNNAFRDTPPKTIISFYETGRSPTAVQQKGGKWTMSGPLKVLVEVSSAVRDSTHQHPINRTHSELVKYSTRYDEVYERVRTALLPLVKKSQNRATGENKRVGDTLSKSLPLSSDNYGCLRSLAFREQEHRFEEIHSASGTCEWLLDDPQYRAWVDQPRGLFWIKGNPGAGKSVLMKFATIMMDRRMNGGNVFSFFFHGRGSSLQRTPLGLFRALLHSMLDLFPDHLRQLTKKFEERQKRHGDYQEKRWEWTEKELHELIYEVLSDGTRNRLIVVFVDALDECGQEQAKTLLSYFKDLMNNIQRKKAQTKICISSRHYPILGLATIPSISVEDRNDKDIRLFIREQLKEISPDSTRQKLESEISLKAHGVFQWVVLITRIVIDRKATGVKVETLLEQLKVTPEALDELYAGILNGVKETEQYQMRKLYQWVLFAERPLSAQELREALATDKDMTCTTITELRRHESWIDSVEDFEKHVLHISRGLVEFQTRELWEQYGPDAEDQDREVQFVHHSVADYILKNLFSENGSDSPSIYGNANFELSRSCLRYLTLREVLGGAQRSRGSLSATFPLLPYVVESSIHHIREVEREGIPQPDLLSLIPWHQLDFLEKLAAVWGIVDSRHNCTPVGWPFPGATLLHILVALGSKSAFDTLLRNDDTQVDGKDSNGDTPLLLAIRDGQPQMALCLLGRSIDWQHRHGENESSTTQQRGIRTHENSVVDVNVENDDGESLLTMALRDNAGGRNKEVIFKLIEAGADVNIFGDEAELFHDAIRTRNEILLLVLLESEVGEGRTPLSWAAENGYEAVVRLLIEKDAKTDLKDSDSRTPLLWAARNGHEAIVRLLLKKDAKADSKDSNGRTPLSWAARNGYEAVMRLLLKKGAEADSRDSDSRTPLSWAAWNGHEAAVRLLLEEGAEVDSKDSEFGQTPLCWAAENGHEAIMRLLLEYGAEADSKDSEFGQTPLYWAAENGHEAIMRLLLEHGAKAESKDSDGRTPLSSAAENGHKAIVRLLLEEGAEADSKDSEFGQTPLCWAAENGHEAVMRLLLEEGAEVDSKDSISRRTPLSWAAGNGHEAAVRLLLEEGAEVDSNDSISRRTPLSWAAGNGYEAVVRLLLKEGAEVDSNDSKFGRTPLSLAAMNGHEVVVQALIEGKADVNASDMYGSTPLSWASEYGFDAMARVLIENEAKVDQSIWNGSTPLLIASRHGHAGVVRLLVEGKADVNASNMHGSTPLSWASENGHETLVNILMENGAEVDRRIVDESTPLFLASRNGYEAIVQALVKGKADVNASNMYGSTALSWASQNGHETVVSILTENGAEIDRKIGNGATPLLLALEKGHEAVARILIENGAVIEITDEMDRHHSYSPRKTVLRG